MRNRLIRQLEENKKTAKLLRWAWFLNDNKTNKRFVLKKYLYTIGSDLERHKLIKKFTNNSISPNSNVENPRRWGKHRLRVELTQQEKISIDKMYDDIWDEYGEVPQCVYKRYRKVRRL